MPRGRSSHATSGEEARRPRRLPWSARYEQLTAAAMPIVAEQGFSTFSMEQVTARADVTRKLLYHYFPRGRPDVVLAVVKQAGHQLTDDWVIDESIPLAERLAANNARIIRHAMQPSDAWRIYRLARTSPDDRIRQLVESFVETVISSISQNQLGITEPPPLPRMAIRGYLAFFESVLDDARATGVPFDAVLRMLGETLLQAVRSALAAGA